MTYEEYKTELQRLEDKLKEDKSELAKRFAFQSQKHFKGDIVYDNSETMLITQVKYNIGFHSPPYLIYYGEKRKKDGTPMKKPVGTSILAHNVRGKI